jgi:hypothetical protein
MSLDSTSLAKFASLKYYNAAMSFLHAVSGFFILYLGNGFSFPITTTYLDRNIFLNQVTPITIEVLRLPAAYTVTSILFFCSFSHFLLILPKIHGWYLNGLKKGVNYMRWIEYSVSSAAMIVLIGLLSGIFDFASLVMMFFLDTAMILFGLLSERLSLRDPKGSWAAFSFGCFIGMVPWLIISLYVFGAWQNQTSLIPSYVYRILITIFLFFNSFALNALLSKAKIGPWRDYLFTEKVYLFLSLTSKSVLAWEIFAGTLM